jgi:hypothetical protein
MDSADCLASTGEREPAGILVLDSASDELHVRLLPELRGTG